MAILQRSASRIPANVRTRRARPVLLLALTALATVALGVIVYFAGTSIAWFATAPSSDERFGALNHCLLVAVPKGRAGFAVSQDGARAAAFNGAGLGVCGAGSGEAGRFVPLEGITHAAFDGQGTLWAATGARAGDREWLWRIGEGGPERVAHVAPVALVGHATGALVLDVAGRLVSVSPSGEVRAVEAAPRVPNPTLAVDAAGERVALFGAGALWVYRISDLSQEVGEAPCEVEFVWWLPEPGRALVRCGPGGQWALTLDARTGAKEEAPRRERAPSALVPGLRAYVVGCENLPCEAPGP